MLEEIIIIFVKKQKDSFFSRLSKEKAKQLISNLDNEKAFALLKENSVDKTVLQKEFDKDDFMTYPLIYIDFDRKKIVSSYSEMDYAFEQYCPKEFVGIYGNTLNLISKVFTYWK